MLEAVFRHLHSRGFNCCGVNPNRGAAERRADAFHAMATDEQTATFLDRPVIRPPGRICVQVQCGWKTLDTIDVASFIRLLR
jgi:hypothetical protein